MILKQKKLQLSSATFYIKLDKIKIAYILYANSIRVQLFQKAFNKQFISSILNTSNEKNNPISIGFRNEFPESVLTTSNSDVRKPCIVRQSMLCCACGLYRGLDD